MAKNGKKSERYVHFNVHKANLALARERLKQCNGLEPYLRRTLADLVRLYDSCLAPGLLVPSVLHDAAEEAHFRAEPKAQKALYELASKLRNMPNE